MRLALYQPDIPQNTGTILRTAACLGLAVDIIQPAGFDLSDRALKRAGLDYLPKALLTVHPSWAEFLAAPRAGRLILATAHTARDYRHVANLSADTLLLGRESAGVPPQVAGACDLAVRIVLRDGMRSLNVAVAAAIIAGEALRQIEGAALHPER